MNVELEGGHELCMQGFLADALLNIHPINLIRGLFIHAGYCKVLHGSLTAFLPSALLQRIWPLLSVAWLPQFHLQQLYQQVPSVPSSKCKIELLETCSISIADTLIS